MDTSTLRDAYEQFLAAVARGPYGPPPAGEWPAEFVVAHVIANDRLLAAHLAEALSGASPSYDNRPATRVPYLRTVAEVAAGWDGLLRAARASAEEV